MCNISLGTSGTIFISSNKFGVDENNALHSFAHADGHYHLMGCMLSAASCNKWWMDEILKTKDYPAEQAGITRLGENHVFYLPYLMGERSPHNNPDARAMFIGMSMDTTREDMTQAVLEGVAFGLRDSLEVARSLGIKIERTKICGGGAKSPLWRKIIANVMNMKVDLIESEEGPGYGAAILAAVGCGVFDSVEEAAKKADAMKKKTLKEELTEKAEQADSAILEGKEKEKPARRTTRKKTATAKAVAPKEPTAKKPASAAKKSTSSAKVTKGTKA